MVKNIQKIAEVKLSSCRFEVADFIKNCDCGIAVAEQHVFKKLLNCICKSASFKLRNCDGGLKKKLRVPTSASLRDSCQPLEDIHIGLWILLQLSNSCALAKHSEINTQTLTVVMGLFLTPEKITILLSGGYMNWDGLSLNMKTIDSMITWTVKRKGKKDIYMRYALRSRH